MVRPVRNSRIRLSQGTLFWREVGLGATVLLLHGNWRDSSQWLSMMEQLSQQCHCIAPDLLGFGESSHLPVKAYSIDREAASLADYLVAIRARPHVLVADELGAWVAVRYCLQHPGAVKGLVVMRPEGLAHPTLAARWQRLRWLASPWALRFWILKGVAPILKLMGSDRWFRRVSQRRSELRHFQASCRLLFQRRQSELQSEWIDDGLPHLKVPVLVLQPDNASATTKLANAVFAERLPHAQLAALPGDDAIAWESAAEVIRDWLKADCQWSSSP